MVFLIDMEWYNNNTLNINNLLSKLLNSTDSIAIWQVYST